MRWILVALLLAGAQPALAAVAKPQGERAAAGTPLTLDEMNAYFRGRLCVGDDQLAISFAEDGSYRRIFPDATSFGTYVFKPGTILVRYTGGSSRYKIGQTERFKAYRNASGARLMGASVLRCGLN